MVVERPIPRARAITATVVKPGFLRNCRRAKRKSRSKVGMGSLSGAHLRFEDIPKLSRGEIRPDGFRRASEGLRFRNYFTQASWCPHRPAVADVGHGNGTGIHKVQDA